MNSQQIKEILLSEIHEVSINYEKYCNDPKHDFSRKRKLPFELMLKNIIGMGSKSITNELIDIFQASGEMPSASAFVQQRTKIRPEALKAVFDGFMSRILASADKMRILAVDGSDIQIETNPKDKTSHISTSIDKKSFNLLHLNALYDLEEHVYTDAIIQAAKSQNEHGALNEMVDRSEIPKALVIADRGYESYNDMAHIQEKGWFFLIRIKDGRNGIKMGLELPRRNEFDLDVSLKLTRKQTNDVKKLLSFLQEESLAYYHLKEKEFDSIAKLYMQQTGGLMSDGDKALCDNGMREVERIVLLNIIDRNWPDQIDNMDKLRESISLQAYAQRDPVTQYKLFGCEMFEEMAKHIRHDTVSSLMHFSIEQKVERESPNNKTYHRAERKIGRNETCPCGSGKKYKNCCGKTA